MSKLIILLSKGANKIFYPPKEQRTLEDTPEDSWNVFEHQENTPFEAKVLEEVGNFQLYRTPKSERKESNLFALLVHTIP